MPRGEKLPSNGWIWHCSGNPDPPQVRGRAGARETPSPNARTALAKPSLHEARGQRGQAGRGRPTAGSMAGPCGPSLRRGKRKVPLGCLFPGTQTLVGGESAGAVGSHRVGTWRREFCAPCRQQPSQASTPCARHGGPGVTPPSRPGLGGRSDLRRCVTTSSRSCTRRTDGFRSGIGSASAPGRLPSRGTREREVGLWGQGPGVVRGMRGKCVIPDRR